MRVTGPSRFFVLDAGVFAELMNEWFPMAVPSAGRRGRPPDRSLPAIPAYAAELNQVWTNLIDNALSAMGQTGVLTVRTGRDRDRIFEPFFTTEPVGQGTGLGLDISWRIVAKKHHGAISVESVPGATRFRVRLPASERHGGNTHGPGGVLQL